MPESVRSRPPPAPTPFRPEDVAPFCIDAATMQATPHTALTAEPRNPDDDVLAVLVFGEGSNRKGAYRLKVDRVSAMWGARARFADHVIPCARARTPERSGIRVEVVAASGSETFCGHWDLRPERDAPWHAEFMVSPDTERLRFTIDEAPVLELARPATEPQVDVVLIHGAQVRRDQVRVAVRIVDSARAGQQLKWADVYADAAGACWRAHDLTWQPSDPFVVHVSDAFFSLVFPLPLPAAAAGP